jgi:hypothetical protein
MQDYHNKTTRDEMLLANKRAADMHNLTRIATFFTFVLRPSEFHHIRVQHELHSL